MPEAEPIRFEYSFLLADGAERTFALRLDRVSLDLITEPGPARSPDWTALGCHRCPNCPLSEAEHPRCPIAANVPDLVEFVADVASFDEVDVRVRTDERSYVKRARVSEAVSSLLGIYMVTSGCPVMDRLRPMVRFHLPLATPEETTFRAMAMYLMAQFFRARRGHDPDWGLNGLVPIYEEVQIVNRAFMDRLRRSAVKDASLNAVVRLDILASIILLNLDQDTLDDIEALFSAYLPDADGGAPA